MTTMSETPEPIDCENPAPAPAQPEPVEPGAGASTDEWVRYVNQRYPRRGVTAPGSHMGRR